MSTSPTPRSSGESSGNPPPQTQTKSRLGKAKIGRWLVVALIAASLGFFLWKVGWADTIEHLQRLNPIVAIVLMAILPLFGFSIVVVYVVIGARFGLVEGGLVITGITCVHLLATHFIARSFLRPRIERYLVNHRGKVPEVPTGEDVAVSAMIALVPGLPYFARNCLLAITHIPLKTYFWVCLPIYVLRSYVTLSLGDVGTDLDREKFFILALIYVVKLSICAYLIWHIKKRLGLESLSKKRAPQS